MHLNSIWLEGTMVGEPEEGYTETGAPLCRFEVSSSRVLKESNEYSLFHVEVRDPLLSHCRDHLGKGRGVRIIGRLEQRRWNDRGGTAHANVRILSELIEPRPRFG